MVRARGVPSVRSRRSFECLLGGIGIEPRGGGALRHHAAVGFAPSAPFPHPQPQHTTQAPPQPIHPGPHHPGTPHASTMASMGSMASMAS